MLIRKNTETFYQKADRIVKILPLIIPLMIIFSAIILLRYLSDIGRLDLFSLSINDNASLISILILFILFSASLMMMLLSPGVIFVAGVYQIKKEIVEKSINPITLAAAHIISSILSIEIFIIVSHIDNSDFGLFISAILVISFCLVVNFFALKIQSHVNKQENLFKKSFWTIFNISIFSMITIMMCFGIAITLILSGSDNSSNLLSNLEIYYIGISIISYFAGLCFFPLIFKQQKIRFKPFIKYLLVIPPSIFIILPNMMSVICDKSLELAGIADWTSHHYEIDSKRYPAGLFHKAYWDTTVKPDVTNALFVTAVRPIRLGSNTLLCPSTISKVHRLSLHFYFYEEKQSDTNTKTVLKKMSRDCFILDSSAVNQADTAFSDALPAQ